MNELTLGKDYLVPQPVKVHWKCNLTYHIVVWASSGTVRVHLENDLIELNAGQAMWIPARVAHMVEHESDSLGLSILIPYQVNRTLGDNPVLINVPLSHRQWMFHLMLLTLSPLHAGQVPMSRIVDLLAHFASTDSPRLRTNELKLPSQPAARATAAAILADPRSNLRIRDYAERFSVSERTLNRAFAQQSGVSVGEFKKRARQLATLHRPTLPPQPVPAVNTRWLNLVDQDVILWAARGRAIVHRATTRGTQRSEYSQPLQAGQLLLVRAGHSLRLEVEHGSLLFPLRLPSGSIDPDPHVRLPLQLPANLLNTMMHRAMTHITALRPVHYDPADTLRLVKSIPQFPGLIVPQEPRLSSVARALMTDVAGQRKYQDLATKHGFSLRQLQRLWKLDTQISLRQWHLAHRMQHADALISSGFNISFVARQLGYTNPGNFSRAYTSVHGLGPSTVKNSDKYDTF